MKLAGEDGTPAMSYITPPGVHREVQTGGTCAFFLLRLDTCPLPELIVLLPKRVWLFLLRFSKIDHLYSRVARVRHVHVLPR